MSLLDRLKEMRDDAWLEREVASINTSIDDPDRPLTLEECDAAYMEFNRARGWKHYSQEKVEKKRNGGEFDRYRYAEDVKGWLYFREKYKRGRILSREELDARLPEHLQGLK